jgi:hypothetical protein
LEPAFGCGRPFIGALVTTYPRYYGFEQSFPRRASIELNRLQFACVRTAQYNAETPISRHASAIGASPRLFRTKPGPHTFEMAFLEGCNGRAALASTSGVPSALNWPIYRDTPVFRAGAWTEIHENCATRHQLDKHLPVTDTVP